MVTTLVPMFLTLERTSSKQTKNKSNPHPNRWANPHCMLHPYRGLWPMQPQRRTRAGRSLLSSRLQRCWFGLQSRRLRADPAGCSSTGEFQSEDVFLATPSLGVWCTCSDGCEVAARSLQLEGCKWLDTLFPLHSTGLHAERTVAGYFSKYTSEKVL